jgi:hypothetical protein
MCELAQAAMLCDATRRVVLRLGDAVKDLHGNKLHLIKREGYRMQQQQMIR